MGAMLLSIGNDRSTTRLNFNSTGAWAKATDAVPNARESKTSIRAFIMIVLPTVLATCRVTLGAIAISQLIVLKSTDSRASAVVAVSKADDCEQRENGSATRKTSRGAEAPTERSYVGFCPPMTPDCRCRPDGASARPSTTASPQACSLGAMYEVYIG